MPSPMLKYIYAVTFILIIGTHFNATAETDPPCLVSGDCITEGQWDISVAIGFGQKTNPLQGYDDIPLYVLPSIAYYGEQWFFDNGNFGYSLQEAEKYSLNLVTNYSDDRAFFYNWDPSNLFFSRSTDDNLNIMPMGLSSLSRASEPKVFNSLERRNFTFYGGLEAFYYARLGFFKVSYAHDMFNVHNGDTAHISWNYGLAVKQWVFDLALRADWKSAKVIQYYYGVRQSENSYWSLQYQASSGWNKGMELTTRYILNGQWNILMAYRYTALSDEITDSPLVNQDNSQSYFVGVAYRF
ncbi:MipA/OmpV family protein [Shewanella glacialimarina]|nr:MipA/OmpV family protein [Shewanella glacialimarina]